MSDPLLTYLADHLAGAMHAIELIKNLRDHYKQEPLGLFAADLLNQIEADRNTLESLAKQLGGGPSVIKEAGAWASEKFARLKFGHDDATGLGTFQALEHLSIGIQGKAALWRALSLISQSQQRLHGLDYDTLIARAQKQFSLVEEKRLALAPSALRPSRA
jgi:hypothetical protein